MWRLQLLPPWCNYLLPSDLTVQVGNSSSVSTRWVADLDILTLITTSTMDTSSYYLKNKLNLDTTEKYYILKNEGTNVTLTLDGQAVGSDNVIFLVLIL